MIGDTLGTHWRFMVGEASHSRGAGGQGPGKRRTLRKAVKPFDKQAQYNWEETKSARLHMHTNHLLTGTIASIVGT